MASGRTQALVAPALIRWTRTSAGLDVASAAKKLKVSTELVEAWETGERRPSLAQVRKMASAYKRPLAVFYLPEPPQGFTPLKDFRTLAGKSQPHLTARLAIETRRAQQRREVALEIAAAIEEPLPNFSLTAALGDNPAVVGDALRSVLGVSLEEQFGWKDKYEALNTWKVSVERAGVLVFQTENLPLSEARGFSLASHPLPVVALNSKESPRGRVFTLMHELAHIVLRASGVCDLHDSGGSAKEVDVVEVFCNRVAGAALIPQLSIPGSLEALGLADEREWKDDSLQSFADRYCVSADAALRSLVFAGRYSATSYAARHAVFVRAGEGDKRKNSGPVPYYRRALGWAGRRFARMALDAYDDQRISSSDLTEFLRVKMKQVEQIRTVLRKDSGK